MKSVRTSRRFKIYRSVLATISDEYPVAFPKKGKRPALKIGILSDLLKLSDDLGVSRSDMRLFLSIWMRSTSYLKGVLTASYRIDLQGKPSSLVDRAQRSHAKKNIASRRRSRESMRAAA